MDIPGNGSNPNTDDDVTLEEASNEHEQRPDSNELLLPVQDGTHDGQQFNGAQDTTNEQNNGPAVVPPGRQEAQTSQVFSNFWCCYWSILMVFGLNIVGRFCQWLVSVLLNNIIRIFEFGNRNRYAKTGNSPASDIFLYIFMFFAMFIIVTHTPLNVENTQPYNLVMPNNVNNTHQNLPIDNDNNDIHEDATLYNNFDDDNTNTFAYDEPNVQAILRESITSEVVDDPTCNINPVDSVEAQADTRSNHDSDEESGKIFDSESDFYADDEAETHSDSDNGYNTRSENDSINDNAESCILEINCSISGEDNQIDNNDGMSIISHITDNTDSEDDSINDNDEISVSVDSGLSSESSYDMDGEDSSMDENNEKSLSSDSGCETNGEESLINDDDERSLVSDISYEINNENDEIDGDDKMSIITHITDIISSEDDSIDDNDYLNVSTDDGYCTKSEDVSSIDDDEEVVLAEAHNNAPLDQKISTIEQSIPPILSTGAPSKHILIIEEDADALNDAKHQEILLSFKLTDINSIKQSSSTGLNEESNEGISSLEVLDNTECNINPLDSVEPQDDTLSNDDGVEENKKIISSELVSHDDDENDHPAVNNNQQDQMVSSIEIPLNNAQNNAQLDQISSTDGQSLTQNLPLDVVLDQTSQTSQKPTDQIEDDHQEMVSSIRPTNIHSQKQPSPIVNPNEEPSKQNAK